jgi:predicted nuclease with TOPRIM domain
MVAHTKFYLELRELLGSEYVLNTYSDEEVIEKLILKLGEKFDRDNKLIEELEDRIEELENINDGLEDDIYILHQEIIDLRERLREV